MSIQNSKVDILVGHKITISCNPTPIASLWTASTQVVKEFNLENKYFGQYDVPSDEDRNSSLITFYFPIEGTFDVWCDYTLSNGHSCTVKTTFNVYKPKVQLNAQRDIVRLRYIAQAQQDKLILGDALPHGNTPGIRFNRVMLPNNLPAQLSHIQGDFEFLQTIHFINIKAKKNFTEPYKGFNHDDQAQNLLDSNYPPFLIQTSTPNQREDSPQFNLSRVPRLFYLYAKEQFYTYIFWRPSQQDGWVALRRVYWEWEAETELTSGMWILINKSPTTSASLQDEEVNTLQKYPHWGGWGDDVIMRLNAYIELEPQIEKRMIKNVQQ